MADYEYERLRETVEILSGQRGRNSGKAAICLEDIASILLLPDKLQSKSIQGVITTAQYNALVNDVATIHQLLREIAAGLQKRMM